MFPKVGSLIYTYSENTNYLLHLFGRPDLSERIHMMNSFKDSFTFDGVSGMPEWLACFLLTGKISTSDKFYITYMCALPHDLAYAYGDVNNLHEKEYADMIFYQSLLNNPNISKTMARIFYLTVKKLGTIKGTSFRWGFLKNNP